MLKPKKFLLFLSVLLFSIFSSLLFAEETVTITTYYPSPYGVYNSLQTDKLGVGDNSGDDILNSADVPTTTGNVWIKGSVGIGTADPNTALDLNGALSFRGMSAPPVAPAGQGRIYYDSTVNKFKVSENGGAYVDLIGGMRLGNWEAKSLGTVYQAATDGIVVALDSTATGVIRGYTDGNNPPTTLRAISDTWASGQSIAFPVKKNDYWLVTNVDYASTVYWIPSGE